MKVVFCIPTMTRPYKQTIEALKASVPLIEAAGWEHGLVHEIGCPYISAARATMLRKALDAKADVIVFLDHDVSWEPQDLLTLIDTEGHVVMGTYRFKKAEEEYMGCLTEGQFPTVRADGCIKMAWGPAGFLKVTRTAINQIAKSYPELIYGEPCNPGIDLFQHGAHKGEWWGEDAAFGRRWTECGGEIWLIPTLNIAHHTADESFPGNFHEYLRRRPGGDLSDAPVTPAERKLRAA